MREESIEDPSGAGNGDLSRTVMEVAEKAGRRDRERAVETVRVLVSMCAGSLRGEGGGSRYVQKLLIQLLGLTLVQCIQPYSRFVYMTTYMY